MLLKRFLPLILALALLTQSAAAALPHPITPETPSLGVADRQTDGQETLTQSPPGQASWQVLTSTDQGLRLAFTSPAPELRDLETPQGFFTQVFAPGLENVQMLGHPDLPGFSFIVAAPALAEVELSVSSTNSQRIDLPPGQTIAPVPGFAGLQEPGDPTHIQIEQTFDQPGVYQPATEIYTQVQHYPQELAQVVEDGWLRNLRILRIQVYPYQYAATQGSLLWHPDITLRIDFHPPPSSLLPDRENNIAPQYQPAPIEPAFASLYQQIINYPQAQHWISRPLPNQTTSASTSLGPRLSMAVVSDGIYQLDYAELIAAQPGLAQADPAYFQMYNQGDPVAIWVEGQDDGSFDPGDRVIFYGQAFDGQRLAERYASENTNWRLYLQQQTSGAYTYWKPQFNALMIEKYVQENIYYLTVSGTPGLRMQAINGDPSSNPTNPVPYYLETVRREETNWWWSNDFTSEEVFFWDQLAGNKPFTRTYTSTLSAVYTGTVNAQNSQPVAATVRAEIVAYAQSSAIAPPYDHHVSFSINDQLLFETDPYASGTPGEDLQIWEGRSRFKLATETPASNLLNGQNDFQVGVFTDGALATPNFFFDWFEIEYPRQFEAIDNQIIFARPQIPASQTYPIDIQAFLPFLALNACEPANTKFQVAGFDDLQDPFVLNITNPLQPIRVLNPAPTGDQITFSVPAGLCDKFVVAAATGIKTTQALGAYQPPDLYTAANSVDYMIIAHSDFITATQRLADWRADQGLLTRVLAIDDLYHEFGDGLPHPIAIKNFLAYALEYWAVPPSYVVLVGDGHWNIQNYATYKWGDVPNFMPPNLAYVDPYQGEVDATNLLATARGTDPLADVHLGRLPVNTIAELDAIIDKIIAYENQSAGQAWQSNITFIADNVPDPKDAGDFVAISEALITDYISPQANYQAIRLFENDYGCESDKQCPVMRSAIADTINITGTLLVSYIGHGDVQRWSGERIFRVADLPLLSNTGQYPLVLSMTCLDGSWYYPLSSHNPGLVEALLRQDNAGIIASFSPTGLGVATGHDALQRGFFDTIFREQTNLLGQAAANAKLELYATGQNFDLLHTYLLFGDPALGIKIEVTQEESMFIPILVR